MIPRFDSWSGRVGFFRGAYHTSVGFVIDSIDRAITLDYNLGPQAEDVKNHSERIPKTRAGIAGMVTGAFIDIGVFSLTAYGLMDILSS